MKKFEIIKQTPFSFKNKKNEDVEGVAYTVAYKGRVIQVSTLNFDKSELKAEGDILNVLCDVELVRDSFETSDDRTVNTLKLVPQLDLRIV